MKSAVISIVAQVSLRFVDLEFFCKCLGEVKLGYMLGLAAFGEISVAAGLVHLPTSGV